MKSVMVDEIVGLAGNSIPPQKMEEFQRVRKQGYEFKNPMFVEWEYGKKGEDQGMGYWTSENMNKLVAEYIELFNFLYPDHTMLLNIDWSANHNAMAPDARMLTNMRARAGGERTRDAEVEQMPFFEKYKLTNKDIGPNVPAEWKRRV